MKRREPLTTSEAFQLEPEMVIRRLMPLKDQRSKRQRSARPPCPWLYQRSSCGRSAALQWLRWRGPHRWAPRCRPPTPTKEPELERSLARAKVESCGAGSCPRRSLMADTYFFLLNTFIIGFLQDSPGLVRPSSLTLATTCAPSTPGTPPLTLSRSASSSSCCRTRRSSPSTPSRASCSRSTAACSTRSTRPRTPASLPRAAPTPERHSPPRPSRRPLPYPRHRQPLLPPLPSPSALTSSLRQAAWPW